MVRSLNEQSSNYVGPMKLQWTICDGIGPFFRVCTQERINWSKIPFYAIEMAWQEGFELFWAKIFEDFRRYCHAVQRVGFNVITLDDLAHLYQHPSYPEVLRDKIDIYRRQYSMLFDIAQSYGLEVWLTSDLIFWNHHLQDSLEKSKLSLEKFFKEACQSVLRDFPQIKGLVLRFGESDGKDVEGDFISKLAVRTPKQMRQFLKTLLPIFEELQRWCILRTWSVGVYSIGDMIWNPKTIEQSLQGLSSTRLVLSMKYGQSDFFRYLTINECFWVSPIPKIVELQGRREYEGAGRFPSFIGKEYEIYRNELSECASLSGIMVWAQTGGWTKCRRLTFLDDNGLWNEINVKVTVALFQSKRSCDDVLRDLWQEVFPEMDLEPWLKFCELSHEAIRRSFYIEDFALQRLFFRRVRIPPMLGITWDTIWIHPLLNEVIRPYLVDSTRMLSRSWEAVSMVDEMLEIIGDHPLKEDLLLFRDTVEMLVLSRQIAFGHERETYYARLHELIDKSRHPESYRCQLPKDYSPKSLSLLRCIRFFWRDRGKYRIFDHLFTLRLMATVFPLIYKFKKKHIPKDLRDQAMGIESLFK